MFCLTAKAAAPSSLLRVPRTGVSSGRSSRSHRRSTLVVTAAKKKKKGGGGGGSGDNDYEYDDAGLFYDDDYGSSAGRAATRYPQNVDPFRSGSPGGKKGPSKKARRQKGSEDDVVADVSTVLSPGYKPRRSKVPAIGDSIDDGDFIGASIDEGFGGGGGGGFPTKTVSAPPRPTAAVKESVSAALISFDEDEAWSIAEADLAEVNAAPKQAPKPKNKMKKNHEAWLGKPLIF